MEKIPSKSNALPVLSRPQLEADVTLLAPMSRVQREMTNELLAQDSDLLIRASDALATHKPSITAADLRTAKNLISALRKCCNHPFLFDGLEQAAAVLGSDFVSASGKLHVLDRLLWRLLPRGHRVVIFAQKTSTLEILERFCKQLGYPHVRLDGATNHVQHHVSSGQMGDQTKIFLCSTRTSGPGISPTAAVDNVVFYDSDCDPQVDQKAIDRVQRINQTFVSWRLLSRDSVEDGRSVLMAGETISGDHLLAMLCAANSALKKSSWWMYHDDAKEVEAIVTNGERDVQKQLTGAAPSPPDEGAALERGVKLVVPVDETAVEDASPRKRAKKGRVQSMTK